MLRSQKYGTSNHILFEATQTSHDSSTVIVYSNVCVYILELSNFVTVFQRTNVLLMHFSGLFRTGRNIVRAKKLYSCLCLCY